MSGHNAFSIHHILPHIRVRFTPEVKPEPKVKKNIRKYDHMQMLLDRIAGMKWYDIGVKHGVTGKTHDAVTITTRSVSMNSKAALKLTSKQIELLIKP